MAFLSFFHCCLSTINRTMEICKRLNSNIRKQVLDTAVIEGQKVGHYVIKIISWLITQVMNPVVVHVVTGALLVLQSSH